MYGKMIAYIDSLLEHDDHSGAVAVTDNARRVVADIEYMKEERKERETRREREMEKIKSREAKSKRDK